MGTENVDETVAAADEPKGPDAFAAARASVREQSQDQVPAESTPDDTSTSEPAEDTAKVADQPTETTDDQDALLTPDELAALPPKERAKAEKWQAKLTHESQRQSAERKSLEEWNPLIEGLKTNPAAALESIAKRLGYSVSKAGDQDTKTVDAEPLTPELEFLRPVFESREKALEARIRAELAPVKQAQAKMVTEAAAAETEGTIKAFSADPRFKGWEKHESKMIEIGTRITPNGMNDFDYMALLYREATAGISEAEQTKKVVARINSSAQASERKTSGIPNERVAHAMPPPDKRTFRDAYEAAKRGEVWEK